ncbi:M48 family metalloprotease [Polyangium spumosum]|uniref:M48 family metalloprotease n=1 Tax=Polyangium spumosum TaxID=889282 RepID=A0A6N7PWI1_9BACT|nr:M48 family metalloprotease [Polyangium spumosum]
MSGAEAGSKQSASSTGFGHSPRRLAAELGLLLLAIVLLIFGARSCAGCAATAIVAAIPPDADAAIGKSAGEAMRAQHGLSGAPTEEQKARVDRIFEELRSGLTDEEKAILVAPRVTVVKDDQVNAFALPGGEVFVLTGLLDRAKDDDDQVRGVLAHEIGHAVKRHGVRSLVRNAVFGLTIAFVVGDLNDVTATVIAGASQLDTLSYSRSMEEEADAFGVDLLGRRKYSPEGLARFLESLESAPVPELLSTHPDSDARAKAIRERMQSGK